MKHLFLAALAFPLITFASGKEVSCQLKDLSTCKDCEKRIPVSCEDHLFNGSVDWKTKVSQAAWLVYNSKTGTERLVTSESKTWHLQDFKNRQNWKSLAQKSKVQVLPEETISLDHVRISAASALYTGQSDMTVVQMKAQTSGRTVASAGQDPIAGGVKRAQSKSNQK